MQNEKKKTAAMWKKKANNGNEYFSVKLADGSWVNLFWNKFKTSEKHPDYVELIQKTESSTQSLNDEETPF